METKLIKLLICKKEFDYEETIVLGAIDYNNMSQEDVKNKVYDILSEYEDAFLLSIYDEEELHEFVKEIVNGGDFYDGDETFKLIETTLYF